jgi:sporulation protein YlmC with PRC-barrel domain
LLDISSLEVLAYTCIMPHHSEQMVLMAHDIRQYATDCFIVDDEEELTEPGDIVRLDDKLRIQYSPIGKCVFADTGRKVGNVEDYSINLETSRVQRLFIRQPLLRAWFSSLLIIDRTQIIDITPDRITVLDSTVSQPIMSPDRLPETHP